MEKSKLIKVGNHYVPWEYHYWDEGGEYREEHREDVNASLPRIFWEEEYQKWGIKFVDADIGGYDCAVFKWYFDSKEDIIKEMERE